MDNTTNVPNHDLETLLLEQMELLRKVPAYQGDDQTRAASVMADLAKTVMWIRKDRASTC